MKSNQHGSIHLYLIIILALLLITGIGYFVYEKQSTDKTTSNIGLLTSSEDELQTNSNELSVDNGENIIIKTDADLKKIPNFMPNRFKETIKLSINITVSPGCKFYYEFSKFSTVNVLGTYYEYPLRGYEDYCKNSRSVIFVQNPNGEWVTIGDNDTNCTTSQGGKIYSEFMEFCITKSGTQIKNPNGSIKSLER